LPSLKERSSADPEIGDRYGFELLADVGMLGNFLG
jgi:hypothetical protein